MKKIIFFIAIISSFSAFAQQEAKCAKAIGSLAKASHDYGVYVEKLRAAHTELEIESIDPRILEAKISAIEPVLAAKKAVLNMSAQMISVSCMSANMLSSGSYITNEIHERFPDEGIKE